MLFVSAREQPERLAIGQLLINLLRLFRSELAVRGEESAGVEGIRPAHLQVFGSIKAEGSRPVSYTHLTLPTNREV